MQTISSFIKLQNNEWVFHCKFSLACSYLNKKWIGWDWGNKCVFTLCPQKFYQQFCGIYIEIVIFQPISSKLKIFHFKTLCKRVLIKTQTKQPMSQTMEPKNEICRQKSKKKCKNLETSLLLTPSTRNVRTQVRNLKYFVILHPGEVLNFFKFRLF